MLVHSKDIFTVELDFKKCFDNIPLEKAIGFIKEMGIKNFQLLRTIKHLMWTSEEYSGVGLSQGTILGPLLANCYLTKLDNFIEKIFETNQNIKHYQRDYKTHKENWIQWNLERGKKIHCKYYRYADDAFITCHNEAEQKFIATVISKFVKENLALELNTDKSHFRHNEIHFLGFKIIKNKRSVWILIDNLYYRSKHSALRKVGNVYKYGQGRQENIIDVFTLRKATGTSFKEYIVASQWLKKRELLEYKDSAKAFNGSNQYLWSLWTIQRGKDAVTKENLILVSSKTHYLIHHGKDLDKKFEKYRKHLK